MTFCIGVRVRAGVVVLADTRVVKGSEISQKSKLSMFDVGEHDIALMTSGLRSVRDKVVARLDDRLAAGDGHLRVHEFASAYGDALRSVREEDEAALTSGGFAFNSHAILGGRLVGDTEPSLLHVYPEGNWVEATDDAPYFVIGRTSYGKPILDRLLTVDSTLRQAVTLAYLAFDATRASATDVDFPVDVAVLGRDHQHFTQQRFHLGDLSEVHDEWHSHLRAALDELPDEWAAALLDHGPTELAT